MLDSFYNFSKKRLFWYLVAAYFFLMEMIALFYQYVLDWYPCALCVQVRAWVWGAVIASLATAFVHDKCTPILLEAPEKVCSSVK